MTAQPLPYTAIIHMGINDPTEVLQYEFANYKTQGSDAPPYMIAPQLQDIFSDMYLISER